MSVLSAALLRALLAALVLIAPSYAQVTSGSITGAAMDASNAAVAGAAIKLTNTGTSVSRSTASDNAGNFQFQLVPPGIYVLEATSPGFRTFRREGIVVEADRSLAVPITLSVGQVTETVEVVGGTPLLEPNTSSLGTVMDTQKIIDLPLNGRNPMGLANLIPTVRGVGFFGGQVLSTWRTAAVNISGGQPLLNSFLIDGVANDKIGDAAGAMTYLTVDATQEFKVLTNSMSAEYGRTGGGVISVISRSGANEYHGSLFEFLRNDNFNANNFFNNSSRAPLPPLAVNQYGGTVGGRLKRDKAFFFFNYEGYRERRAQTRIITSPSARERGGDFSQTLTGAGALINIFDPLTTTTTGGTPVRQQFPGNVIPASRITTMARETLRMVPEGNLAGLANSRAQNLFQAAKSPINRYAWGLKGDYNLSERSRFAIRYTRDVLEPWQFPNFFNSVIDIDGRWISIPRHSATAQFTHSISPTFLVEARAGINTDGEKGYAPFSQEMGKGYELTQLGFPQSFIDQRQRGHFTPRGAFPVFNVADFTNFGAGTPDQIRTGLSWDTSVMATKILSNHTMKFGYDKRFSAFNFSGVGNSTFTFNRGFTQGPNPNAASTTAGFGTASFLLGMPASGTNTFNPDYSIGQHYHAAFLQEDWKVSKTLTLNLGVRYEFETPQTERFNAFANFDPNANAPIQAPGLALKGAPVFTAAQAGGTRYITDPKHDMFAPRIGYAWQVRQRLVARGGYGITWIPIKGTGIPTYPGYAAITPMVNSIDGGLTPRDTISNPFPQGLVRPTNSSLGAITLIGSDLQVQMRNPKPGYMQQWNFTLQFEPFANWLIEGAYVGSKGTRVLTTQSLNLNQLDPQYFSLGNALNQSVPNPFLGIITTGPLSGPTVTRQQLLRPYPQYNSVTGGWSSLGDSIYHAYAMKIEKRFSQGFSILAAYTLSKTIDAAAGSGGAVRPGGAADTGIINWYNIRNDRSKGVEDVPQRLVLTGLWALPWFKQGPAATRFLLGGWQFNVIGTFESGRTIALQAGGGNRPNVVAGQDVKAGGKTIDRWFNTAAYSTPALFTYGNASRTIPNVASDGVENLDFSLLKDFKIGEKKTIQFRAEAFNLANTVVFDTPVANQLATTFGVVTATAFSPKPRELQFALKFSF